MVGRLKETELIDSGKGRECIDKPDVRSLGSLNRANATIMSGMDVPHFETRSLSVQTARAQSRQASFVSELGQRIDLILELDLADFGEKVPHYGGQRFRVD